MPYYSGQGKFYVSDRDINGDANAYRHIGNVSAFNLSIEIDKFEHQESTTGQRATDLTIINEKTASFTMTLEDFDLDNLALALFGTNTLVAAGTGVLQVFTDAVLDQPLALNNPYNVTNVVVKDSTDVTTYVLNTDYTVDTTYGTVTPLSTGSMAAGDGPRITYDHGAYRKVEAFNSTSKIVSLRFEGINTVSGEDPIILTVFKAEFDPVSGYEFLTDEGIAALELTGSALVDSTKPSNNQFFEEILLAAGS